MADPRGAAIGIARIAALAAMGLASVTGAHW